MMKNKELITTETSEKIMNLSDAEDPANDMMRELGYIAQLKQNGNFAIKKVINGKLFPYATVTFRKVYFDNPDEFIKLHYVPIDVIRAISYLEYTIKNVRENDL